MNESFQLESTMSPKQHTLAFSPLFGTPTTPANKKSSKLALKKYNHPSSCRFESPTFSAKLTLTNDESSRKDCLVPLKKESSTKVKTGNDHFRKPSSFVPVAVDDTTTSVFNDISVIDGGHRGHSSEMAALNSTFAENTRNVQFHELFRKNCPAPSQKIEDEHDVICLDSPDSDSDKCAGVKNSNKMILTRSNSSSVISSSNDSDGVYIDRKIEKRTTVKSTGVVENVLIEKNNDGDQYSDISLTEIKQVLDDIYGLKWRERENEVLRLREPRTEPRQNLASKINDVHRAVCKTQVQTFKKPAPRLKANSNPKPMADKPSQSSRGKAKHKNDSFIYDSSESSLSSLSDLDSDSDDFVIRPPLKQNRRLLFSDDDDDVPNQTPSSLKTSKAVSKPRQKRLMLLDSESDDDDVFLPNTPAISKPLDFDFKTPISHTRNNRDNSDCIAKTISKSVTKKSAKKLLDRREYMPTFNSDDSDEELLLRGSIPKSVRKKSTKKVLNLDDDNVDNESGKNVPKSISKSVTKKFDKKAVARREHLPTFNSDDSDEENNDRWQAPKQVQISSKSTPRSCSFLQSLSRTVELADCHPDARIYRTKFEANRNDLVARLYKLYNDKVFDGILATGGEDVDGNKNKVPGVPVEWTSRMLRTAGTCSCKKIKHRDGTVERSCFIKLSTKVLDKPDRLRDTLVHEMCHAVNWIVDNESGHGPSWKAWAAKAMRCFPELPPIKRCHAYSIETKYTYRCTECGYSFGRHSKSVDMDLKRCGRCKGGKFELLLNKKVNDGGPALATPVTAKEKKPMTPFARFVKENYATTKSPQLKHGDVMKLLSLKFSEAKLTTAKNCDPIDF